MQRFKIDETIRDLIVGNPTCVDAAHYKPQDEEILREYLKAVDSLAINNEFRLKKQIQYYKQKADGMDELREELQCLKEHMSLTY